MDIKEAEADAGLTELCKAWDFYLVYKSLAGDLLNMSKVTEKTVNEVYTYLLCSKDERDYEERYMEIIKAKK